MSKNVGNAPSLDDLNAAMASRYTDPAAAQPAPASSPPPAETTPSAAREAKPAMTRRSWLLPTEVADALTDAANRIHHATQGRVSKSEVQAAIIRAGLDRQDDVAATFDATSATDRT